MTKAILNLSAIFFLFTLGWGSIGVGQETGQLNPDHPDYILKTAPYDYEFTKIDNNIWMAERAPQWRFPIIGNTYIIEGESEVLVYDLGGNSQQILDFVKDEIGKPIEYLIISHFHGDHFYGSRAIKEAFPNLKTIAHENTIASIATQSQNQDTKVIRMGQALLQFQAYFLGLPENPKDPMVAADKRFYAQLLADAGPVLENAFSEFTLVPETPLPTGGGMTIDLGNMKVEIKDIGFGNTNGDIVAWIAESKTLIAGDILTKPVPFGYPFNPRETVKTLDKIIQYEIDHLLLGHGKALSNHDYTHYIRNMIDRINSDVENLVAEGKTLEEIRSLINFEEYKAYFAKGGIMDALLFQDYFMAPIIGRSYNEIVPQEN